VKRILIITYYWPPSGGAGVQRWLKFVKYLGKEGYEAAVYTPSNPENPVDDNSLLRDIPTGIKVLQQPIWEPYDLYKRFVGKQKNEKINTGFLSENKKAGLAEKMAVWLRGNLFIPDARKYWIKPSVKFLSSYLEKNPIDAIVSTGPPHSMHLIALALKQKYNIPWLADFRDPWTNIDYYKDLMLTASADRKHHSLEKQVLTTADAVVTIGETMKQEFEKIAGRQVEVITNGFDEDDIIKDAIKLDATFSLAHIGTLVKTRNPRMLWEVLHEMVSVDRSFAADLEIKLVGKVDLSVTDSINEAGLQGYTKKVDYLSHDQVIKIQQQSQLLLLLLNDTPNAKGILTGKFFEYMAAGRPVLCIGPVDGDAAQIIHSTQCGVTIDFNDKASLKNAIENYYMQFKAGSLRVNNENIQLYSRASLTNKLAGLLNKMIKNKAVN
jgi:glycosyltransferase involved in cell wall biosynthesis